MSGSSHELRKGRSAYKAREQVGCGLNRLFAHLHIETVGGIYTILQNQNKSANPCSAACFLHCMSYEAKKSTPRENKHLLCNCQQFA